VLDQATLGQVRCVGAIAFAFVVVVCHGFLARSNQQTGED
jgi:hypothetical protein